MPQLAPHAHYKSAYVMQPRSRYLDKLSNTSEFRLAYIVRNLFLSVSTGHKKRRRMLLSKTVSNVKVLNQ